MEERKHKLVLTGCRLAYIVANESVLGSIWPRIVELVSLHCKLYAVPVVMAGSIGANLT